MTKTLAGPRRLAVLLVALGLAAGLSLAWTAVAEDAAAAVVNNGTLKIHEQGTPSGTEGNDPRVCVFNVEGFGFDAGHTGSLLFAVQGGDGPAGTSAGPYAFGPAAANGYYSTQYFTLDPGHYKATLYDRAGADGIEQAASKVFKVTCAVEPSPSPSPSISESPSPSPSPSVEPSQSASPSVAPSVATNESPAVGPDTVTRPRVAPAVAGDRLATTGAQLTWIALIGLALLIGGFALVTVFHKDLSA